MSILENTSPTLATTHYGAPAVMVYESHGQDCRYKPLGDVCSTVSQKYGTGGNNVPIVVINDEREEVLHGS